MPHRTATYLWRTRRRRHKKAKLRRDYKKSLEAAERKAEKGSKTEEEVEEIPVTPKESTEEQEAGEERGEYVPEELPQRRKTSAIATPQSPIEEQEEVEIQPPKTPPAPVSPEPEEPVREEPPVTTTKSLHKKPFPTPSKPLTRPPPSSKPGVEAPKKLKPTPPPKPTEPTPLPKPQGPPVAPSKPVSESAKKPIQQKLITQDIRKLLKGKIKEIEKQKGICFVETLIPVS